MANPETSLYDRVAAIIEAARADVARSVNTAMVHAYWHVGREIVQVEQDGRDRAGYGDELLKHLSTRLTRQFGKGLSEPNVRNMRQFFLSYRDGSTVPEGYGGPSKRSALPRSP